MTFPLTNGVALQLSFGSGDEDTAGSMALLGTIVPIFDNGTLALNDGNMALPGTNLPVFDDGTVALEDSALVFIEGTLAVLSKEEHAISANIDSGASSAISASSPRGRPLSVACNADAVYTCDDNRDGGVDLGVVAEAYGVLKGAILQEDSNGCDNDGGGEGAKGARGARECDR